MKNERTEAVLIAIITRTAIVRFGIFAGAFGLILTGCGRRLGT
jgi:hypothetical protein